MAALLAPAAAAQSLFFDDFENGLGNWTSTDLWHLQEAGQSCSAPLLPFPSGARCAAYVYPGTCNFALGSFAGGTLSQTASIALPAGASNLVLRYRRHHDSELCSELEYDLAWVWISVDDGATWGTGPAFTDCRAATVPWQPAPKWVNSRADLQAYAGQSIRLRFEFRSGDKVSNFGRGWWLDDVEIAAEPGARFCAASSGACPCGNFDGVFYPGAPAEDVGGCRHSMRAEAELHGRGTASVSNDSLVLRVSDARPGAPLVFLQGTSAQSVPFGDGRLCVGGSTVRLAVRTGTGPVEDYPRAGETPLSIRGALPAAGGTRYYQAVYRDAAIYCTSGTYSTSNAYRIDWTP